VTDSLLPSAGRLLRAGGLEAELHVPALRYIRFNGAELARRIYPAIRDDSWGTVPAIVTSLKVAQRRDRFFVTFRAAHRRGDLAFAWLAAIVGSAEGYVEYSMDGTAGQSFDFNRIGLCVLHPLTHAGLACETTSRGASTKDVLPLGIAPQRWENGRIYPVIGPFDGLRIQVAPSASVNFEFNGDEFELEDQRNWADGSFKTYSTPLSKGWPHKAGAGDRITQPVQLKAESSQALEESSRAASTPSHRASSRSSPSVTIGDPVAQLPEIGLQLPADPAGDSAAALSLRPLALSHLRVELFPETEEDTRPHLTRATTLGRALGAQLEVAIHLPSGNVDAIPEFDADEAVARVLVLRSGFEVGDSRLASLVRKRLPGVPILAGTIGSFAEINRSGADFSRVDGLAFPIAPTVHDIDGLSVVEGIAAIAEIVRTARALVGGRAVVPTPLTLRQRWNPASRAWRLEDATDDRIDTPFAAGWLLGVLGQLAIARAEAVTLFETIGPRGVQSFDGAHFPVFALLAEIAKRHDSTVLATETSDPLRIVALALRRSGDTSVLVANLRPEPCSLRINTGRGRSGARIYRFSQAPTFGAPVSDGTYEHTDLSHTDLAAFEVALLELSARTTRPELAQGSKWED
jgi:hypothetical protein